MAIQSTITVKVVDRQTRETIARGTAFHGGHLLRLEECMKELKIRYRYSSPHNAYIIDFKDDLQRHYFYNALSDYLEFNRVFNLPKVDE